MKHCIISFILTCFLYSQECNIARIQYGGGGDWYSDPSSLPNLLDYLKTYTPMKKAGAEIKIKLTDNNAKHHPYLYMTCLLYTSDAADEEDSVDLGGRRTIKKKKKKKKKKIQSQ